MASDILGGIRDQKAKQFLEGHRRRKKVRTGAFPDWGEPETIKIFSQKKKKKSLSVKIKWSEKRINLDKNVRLLLSGGNIDHLAQEAVML